MQKYSSLEKYILSIVTIEDYYDNHIVPIDPKRFNLGGFTTGKRTTICPFHGDSDPSLGIINDKHDKNIKKYHCLGCGAVGTVIRMHQRVMREYYGKVMTDIEATRDLALLYKDIVDLTKIVDIDESSDQAYFMKARLAIRMAQKRYTVRDYSSDLLKVRKIRHEIPLEEQVRMINSATIKILVTEGGLLD